MVRKLTGSDLRQQLASQLYRHENDLKLKLLQHKQRLLLERDKLLMRELGHRALRRSRYSFFEGPVVARPIRDPELESHPEADRRTRTPMMLTSSKPSVLELASPFSLPRKPSAPQIWRD